MQEHVSELNGYSQQFVPEFVPKIVDQVKAADDKVVAFVKERPLVAIGAAVAVGYMIGRIFTRIG
jgi:ElaB/YqjD/DUF883 family membrane-anchored ribosome-binding protein